ncbi:segregation/condensation protein A [bacterium]|nr:segregation/condensation protein A [bacterium]
MQITEDKKESIDLSKVKVREIFEGPLDLLLYLIQVNEIDVYDIPIAEITGQYLEYIEIMKELNLDIAGEFLLMAAKLVYIKSRMMLPRFDEKDTEEIEDPRAELVERLIEHEKFRATARILREMEQSQSQYVSRDNIYDIEVEYEFDELSIDALFKAYQMTIKFMESSRFQSTAINQIDINEKIDFIINAMKSKNKVRFVELVHEKASRVEIIVLFLALLELIRKKILKVVQRKFLGNITISCMAE